MCNEMEEAHICAPLFFPLLFKFLVLVFVLQRRKQRQLDQASSQPSDFVCDTCGMDCHARIGGPSGYFSKWRGATRHFEKQSEGPGDEVVSNEITGGMCEHWNKIHRLAKVRYQPLFGDEPAFSVQRLDTASMFGLEQNKRCTDSGVGLLRTPCKVFWVAWSFVFESMSKPEERLQEGKERNAFLIMTESRSNRR